tara:strand:+ start:937 stop:1581 length:645 start_codon:yes stop_codon:yes gene_type:complete
MPKQVKSKQRVSEFGEVNTSKREVESMLDLVIHETERLDSRFLEPACGDGNFLIEVLRRKLRILVKNYKNNQYEFEKNSIVMIGSIYGLDILEDNAESARKRLLTEFLKVYEKHFRKNINKNLIKSIKYILKRNIIHGDALTLKQVISEKPVIFCEWAIINNKLKRRDFSLSDLLIYAPFEKGSIFSDMGEEAFIPDPLKEYALVEFDMAFKTC